jgi:UDP-N-acetylmuramoyl-L-alanine---L-glutamate ligase
MPNTPFHLRFGSLYVPLSLEGKRIAVWGYGREGRAALRYLRRQLPSQTLTVFCNADEALQIAEQGDRNISCAHDPDAAALSAFDVVVKSPGISKYRAEALAAQANGTRFIGGTALWFAAHPGVRTICVTATKGKSTVSALIAHLLRAAGHRTALVGNIGLPLLETMDWREQPEFWVIEMSSYQTFEAVQPEVAVMLNFFPEHLDWHGSEQAYFSDKSALITHTKPSHAVLNAQAPRVAALADGLHSHVHWFNADSGWHSRGHRLYRRNAAVLDMRELPMPGEHNAGNVCAALTAIDALGLDAAALAPAAKQFRPLPHRLQTLGEHGGIRYVNDSISTTPFASMAALDCFSESPVAILVGGYDRGLDWDEFAAYVAAKPPKAIICMGQNGPRIAERLRAIANPGFALHEAANLQQALQQAQAALTEGGVLLLSPGAPSFGAYADYVARGKHFAELAGFDPNAISQIPGLGLG